MTGMCGHICLVLHCNTDCDHALPDSLVMIAQGPSESAVPLLQLPHFDQDLLKRLARKQVRALPDLLLMSPSDRREAYAFGGQSQSDILHGTVSLSNLSELQVSNLHVTSCMHVVCQGVAKPGITAPCV